MFKSRRVCFLSHLARPSLGKDVILAQSTGLSFQSYLRMKAFHRVDKILCLEGRRSEFLVNLKKEKTLIVMLRV